MVKYSWSDSQNSSGDVVYVFTSSIKMADDEITASVTRASVYAVKKKLVSLPFIHSELAEHAGFIFESTFAA